MASAKFEPVTPRRKRAASEVEGGCIRVPPTATTNSEESATPSSRDVPRLVWDDVSDAEDSYLETPSNRRRSPETGPKDEYVFSTPSKQLRRSHRIKSRQKQPTPEQSSLETSKMTDTSRGKPSNRLFPSYLCYNTTSTVTEKYVNNNLNDLYQNKTSFNFTDLRHTAIQSDTTLLEPVSMWFSESSYTFSRQKQVVTKRNRRNRPSLRQETCGQLSIETPKEHSMHSAESTTASSAIPRIQAKLPSTPSRLGLGQISNASVKRFTRILPLDAIERLIDSPGACVAGLVSSPNVRCRRSTKCSGGSRAWVQDLLSKSPPATNLVEAEDILRQLIDRSTCNAYHWQIAQDQLDRLLSLFEESGVRHVWWGAKNLRFTQEDLEALPQWLAAWITPATEQTLTSTESPCVATYSVQGGKSSPEDASLVRPSVSAGQTNDDTERLQKASHLECSVSGHIVIASSQATQRTASNTSEKVVHESAGPSEAVEASSATSTSEIILDRTSTMKVHTSAENEEATTTTVVESVNVRSCTLTNDADLAVCNDEKRLTSSPIEQPVAMIPRHDGISLALEDLTPPMPIVNDVYHTAIPVQASEASSDNQNIKLDTMQAVAGTQSPVLDPCKESPIVSRPLYNDGALLNDVSSTTFHRTDSFAPSQMVSQDGNCANENPDSPGHDQNLSETPNADKALRLGCDDVIIKTEQVNIISATALNHDEDVTQDVMGRSEIKVTETQHTIATTAVDRAAESRFDPAQTITVTFMTAQMRSVTRSSINNRRLLEPVLDSQTHSLHQGFKFFPQRGSLPLNEYIRSCLRRALNWSEFTTDLNKLEQEIHKGWIYMYWIRGDFGFVKIGKTSGPSTARRLNEWRAKCGHEIEEQTLNKYELTKQLPHVYRLESLIHAELDQYRLLEDECRKCGKSHKEWFQVSPSHAQKVIDKWTDFIRGKPYELANGKWRLKRGLETEIDRLCRPLENLTSIQYPVLRQSQPQPPPTKGGPRRSSRLRKDPPTNHKTEDGFKTPRKVKRELP